MGRSMTGYGKAESIAGNRKITVEIRSLNSKQLDLSVRMPPVFRAQDTEIRSVASRIMRRGKVDIHIGMETAEGVKPVNIDEALFSAYYGRLRAIGETNAIEWGGGPLEGAVIQSILRMPDVVAAESDQAGRDEVDALMSAIERALEHIDAFRIAEGKILMADITGRVTAIEKLLSGVAPFEKERIENIKSRIRENLETAGLSADPNRFEQELVYYVERLDVTEEKVRLANHCSYFLEVAANEDAPGRKLGFIAQEMGREINTLGSKANNAPIQRIVVDMKDELEKIKEQLLNIL